MADEELTQWSVAAETREWVGPITVTADGVPTTAFDVTLTAPGARPSLWVAADELDGDKGILIGADTDFELIAGRKYTVWIRFTDDPEIPVQRCGNVRTY